MSLKISKIIIFICFSFSLIIPKALGQIEVDENGETVETPPDTGKKAAQKFFLKRKGVQDSKEESPSPQRSYSSTEGGRFLAIHLGLFFDEESYKWASGNSDDLAEINGGVTYRIGEWVNSMDMNFRADITSYDLKQGKAVKLSLLPLITFPDVRSEFPLYFGAGAGLGVFFKQIKDESNISLDYQILAGARLMNLVENMGLMFEVGMKNHFLILSDGQYNGAYFSIGAVFDF